MAQRAGGNGRRHPRRQQFGAFIITLALALLFLLGFMGIALDFGRLFVVKSELQTAMDSCALAAARELNGQTDAIVRARSAGMVAGNGNRANLQSATWSGQGQLTATDITFRDLNYVATTSGSQARYAECQFTMNGIKLWLLQAMGAFTGDSVTWPSTGAVGARAVATRAVAQSACPIPVQLKQAKFATLNKGDWVVVLDKSGASGSDFGWANLDGSTSATETWAEMEGKYCSTKLGDPIGTAGVKASVFEYWNHRFGIYKNNAGTPANDPSAGRPDFTGYSYNAVSTPSRPTANWLAGRDAYADFRAQRQVFAPCGPNCPAQGSEVALGAGQLQVYGADRRLVLLPVVSAGGTVVDFACMLMLQPIATPVKDDIQLEFRGHAGEPDSPCTTTGLPGGTIGPLVPTLVR
ncbi:pilus assembly protein TadG-related protein [Acidovorax bellezanensis]|uniref:pilus assembly protein TadG-related protein n=1 Tax=Acidovorax bellezanensis TaxID=2976702 RepID=UPI0021C13D9B|nr:pilus assembly protein TadG-related protein [Acidovorax sp. Be4]